MKNNNGYFKVYNSLIDSGLMANLKNNELKVYLALCKFAYHNNKCFPTVEVLAKICGLHRSNIYPAIDSLIERRLIAKTKSTEYKHSKNLYKLVNYNEDTSNIITDLYRKKEWTPRKFIRDKYGKFVKKS